MEVKVVIKLKDIEITLTQQEAQELRDILAELVNGEKVYVPLVQPIYYPAPLPPWGTWFVCTGNTGTLSIGSTGSTGQINATSAPVPPEQITYTISQVG
jgi:hypothetical protein